MASDPFDFSDVFRELEDGIDKFMRDDTTKEVASRMFAESTQELVYDKYTPKGYKRRKENGGLKDWQNYHVLNIGKMNMTVINETMGNWRYAPGFGEIWSEGWDPGYITDIIERGYMYHWTGSEIYQEMPYPRPFMEQACDKFVDDYLMPTIHNVFFND